MKSLIKRTSTMFRVSQTLHVYTAFIMDSVSSFLTSSSPGTGRFLSTGSNLACCPEPTLRDRAADWCHPGHRAETRGKKQSSAGVRGGILVVAEHFSAVVPQASSVESFLEHFAGWRSLVKDWVYYHQHTTQHLSVGSKSKHREKET